MVLLPSLALGGWAEWESVARWRQDEGAMRLAWRALAQEAARSALRSTLDQLRAKAAAIPDGGDPRALAGYLAEGPAELVFLVDGDVVRSSFPPEADVAAAPSDEALERARHDEFAHLPAAAQDYRAILASKPAPALSHEAEAGLIAVLASRGEAAAALAELRSALPDPARIAGNQGAALALSLCAQPLPRGDLAAALLEAYGRILAVPAETALQGRVLEALTQRADAMDEAERARWRVLDALVAHDARARAALLACPPEESQWIASRGGGDWVAPAYRRLATGVVAYAGAHGQHDAVVALLDHERLLAMLDVIVGLQPGLNELAAAYARRYGKPIDAGAQAILIAAPWGAELSIEPVAGMASRGSALLALLPAVAFVACALALASAGVVFLHRTARRDLQLAQLKADFVSNVSHEMKTPLALLRMFGEMLSLGYERDEHERRRYHQIIVQESQRLSMLVSNVLDVAAIENGSKRYHRVPLDAAEVAAEVADTYREQLAADGFTLALALPRPGPMVRADRDALKQVVLNLLSNAMKYARAERWASLSVTTEGSEAVIAVEDHGIGIDPAHHQRIFEPFFRVESGLTRETRGAGLGLSLVRSICVAHGGRVTVDSVEGRGSVFRVRLPSDGAGAT